MRSLLPARARATLLRIAVGEVMRERKLADAGVDVFDACARGCECQRTSERSDVFAFTIMFPFD
jgi:hypothetical protein